jgi:hypothetical protein
MPRFQPLALRESGPRINFSARASLETKCLCLKYASTIYKCFRFFRFGTIPATRPTRCWSSLLFIRFSPVTALCRGGAQGSSYASWSCTLRGFLRSARCDSLSVPSSRRLWQPVAPVQSISEDTTIDRLLPTLRRPDCLARTSCCRYMCRPASRPVLGFYPTVTFFHGPKPRIPWTGRASPSSLTNHVAPAYCKETVTLDG